MEFLVGICLGVMLHKFSTVAPQIALASTTQKPKSTLHHGVPVLPDLAPSRRRLDPEVEVPFR